MDPDTFCHSPMSLAHWKHPQTTAGRIPVPPTTPFETLGGSARPTRPDCRGGPFRAVQKRQLAKAIALDCTQGAFHLKDLFVSRRCLSVADLGRPQSPLCFRPRSRAPRHPRSSLRRSGLLRHLCHQRHTNPDEIRAPLAQPRGTGGAPRRAHRPADDCSVL